MLWRLLRTYLAPYRTLLIGVVILQLIGTIASLYLPSLNADIIDNGVLAGDNAIVVGMAAATVPLEQRRRVIFWGIGAAIALRIFFALITPSSSPSSD